MEIGGLHVSYYFICKRKLWLYLRGVTQEHGSDLVEQGRLIHETSYPERRERYRELIFDGVRIDYYDPVDRIIHELKKSPACRTAHVWQLKHYILRLEERGVEGVTGILEYPRQRRTERIELEPDDRDALEAVYAEIDDLASSAPAPERINAPLCQSCAYHDFCYVSEADPNLNQPATTEALP